MILISVAAFMSQKADERPKSLFSLRNFSKFERQIALVRPQCVAQNLI